MDMEDQPTLFPDLVSLPRFVTDNGPVVALAGLVLAEGLHFIFRYDYFPCRSHASKFSARFMTQVMKKFGFAPGEYDNLRKLLPDLKQPHVGQRVFALCPIQKFKASAACFDGTNWKRQTLCILPGYVQNSDLFLFYRFNRRLHERSRHAFRW
ncbi:MAG TPA: hypothetical protein VFX17_02260 [Patescibacteria group bacterium]|nr:hypothetical protein [Patescibacteria group bacterium]